MFSISTMHSNDRQRLLPLCFILLFLPLVSCGSPEERKATYLQRAQDFLTDNNLPKARVALRNVLKIDPKDTEAMFILGEVEEQEKNWRNAYSHFLQVIELNPNHRNALIKLGKIYLQGGLTDETLETVNSILTTHPNDPVAKTLRAAVTAKQGNISGAITETKKIMTQHPSETDPAILLATLYTSQNRLSDAESILRQGLTYNPNNIEILSTLASTLLRQKKSSEAQNIFIQIVNSEPHIFEHRVRLALLYDHIQNPTQAHQTLKEAVTIDPNDENRWLFFAEYAASRFGSAQAEAILQEAAQSHPDSIKLRFALGKLYEVSNQIHKAEAVYFQVIQDWDGKPQELDAKVKLARLEFSKGNSEAGETQLQEVLNENPRSTSGLLLQGRIALKKRNARDAVLAFRTALKDQPNMAKGYALLGQAFLLQGETHLARENLEKAVALNPQRFEAQRALATLDFGQGQTHKAKSRLENIVQHAPQDIKSLGMLLNLLAHEEDWDLANNTLRQLKNVGFDSFEANMAEGRLYQARQLWEKAEEAYLKASKTRPESPAPLLALVKIDLQQGIPRKAETRLQQILANNPYHLYAHGLLGEIYFRNKQFKHAEDSLRKATTVNPTWIASWLNHAKIYFSQGKVEEGISVLLQGIDVNPSAEELRFILAAKFTETEQYVEAIQAYEGILQLNPKSIVSANNLAALLIDQKGDTESLQRALLLTKDFENTAPHPFFLDTLGWVNVHLGHHKEAVRIMKQAVTKAPNNPLLNYHLGVAYHRAGQPQQSKEYLRKSIETNQPFPEIAKASQLLQELENGASPSGSSAI